MTKSINVHVGAYTVELGGKIILGGGRHYLDIMEEYNPASNKWSKHNVIANIEDLLPPKNMSIRIASVVSA